jgi:hypothetical protein
MLRAGGRRTGPYGAAPPVPQNLHEQRAIRKVTPMSAMKKNSFRPALEVLEGRSLPSGLGSAHALASHHHGHHGHHGHHSHKSGMTVHRENEDGGHDTRRDK